ncbi:MAG TPA: hypothetical protein VH540_21480 [Ktedonobacterales bacterium]|jgi:hypothetical protein
MLKGVHLTLMIGPAVPVPVPQVVLDALTEVQVTTRAEGASGFQLRFTLSNTSPLQTLFLLSGGNAIPLMRVLLIAIINGTPQVLIDGVITHQEIAPGNDAAHSTLTITGEDLTRVMDYIDFSGTPFPAMPAEARVALLIAKYALFGLIPLVIPSVLLDVPIPTDRIPRQQGTDLSYIKQLADEVGYIFYIEPGPAPGSSIAYWGPKLRLSVPQPALNINMDTQTNVESLSFQFDSTSKALPVVYIQIPITKFPLPIPLPAINPLSPPLGLIPPIPNRVTPISGTARRTALQATLIAMAEEAKSAQAVTGSGTLDVLRYGRILKARQLVGVRGAGMAFDGLYFVESVTHNIKRGEYKQSFTLSRNGLVSTVPKVPA